jgi:hypothetical protein
MKVNMKLIFMQLNNKMGTVCIATGATWEAGTFYPSKAPPVLVGFVLLDL